MADKAKGMKPWKAFILLVVLCCAAAIIFLAGLGFLAHVAYMIFDIGWSAIG